MRRSVAFVAACVAALSWAGAAARAGGAGQEARPAGEVLVVLNEAFMSNLLEAVASQPKPPSFPLARRKDEEGRPPEGGCRREVTLLRESGGVRTAVRFREGRVNAPVAFRGSYEAPLIGCLRFEGWADTYFALAFDAGRQALTARLEVRSVNLRNVPSAVTGGVAGLVQDAVDARLNPVEILRAEQLGATLPATRDPALRLRAREVRHEIAGPELRLRIFYEIARAE